MIVKLLAVITHHDDNRVFRELCIDQVFQQLTKVIISLSNLLVV